VGGPIGIRRQAFYQHKSRQLIGEGRDEQVLSLVEQTRRDHPGIGGKLYELLKEGMIGKAGPPLRDKIEQEFII